MIGPEEASCARGDHRSDQVIPSWYAGHHQAGGLTAGAD